LRIIYEFDHVRYNEVPHSVKGGEFHKKTESYQIFQFGIWNLRLKAVILFT